MISRKIVEAHQGSMTAGRSERLDGARFDIVIPALAEAPAPGLTNDLVKDQKTKTAMEATT